LSLACSLTYDSADELRELRDPSVLSSYNPELYSGAEYGYYKIDPETILTALDQGETDVFKPLLEDPQLVEELTDISILWIQTDILKITSALGQLVWDDPMDPKDWNVDFLLFWGETCQDGSMGFFDTHITYYKMIEVDGKKVYITRLVEIDPYVGMVRWGGGATYPQPISNKWNGVNLSEAKITTDDALHITYENGGRDALLQLDRECGGILLSIPPHGDNQHWYLGSGVSKDLSWIIDLQTGEIEALK
jgi:hypothetical protein